MSWQAQTAVNHHSKQTNMGLFRLLLYLAEVADQAGIVDPAPAQETLAEFFDCTDRTIRNRIKALCTSGELKQTRVGSGFGNASAYQICLPIPENSGNEENTSWMQGGKKAEINPAILSTIEALKAEIKAEILELKVEIFRLKVEKVESEGGKGGNERRKASWSESADDPTLIQDVDPEEEKETPPTPPQPFGFQNNGRNPEQTPADARTQAILAVCKKNGDIPKHKREAENASAQLGGYTAEYILKRYGRPPENHDPSEWNWYLEDFRGQKGQAPTPGQVIDCIALTAELPLANSKPAQNGQQPTSNLDAIKARVSAKLAKEQPAHV